MADEAGGRLRLTHDPADGWHEYSLFVEGEDGDHVAYISRSDAKGKESGQRLENAWNACVGIPTAELEGVSVKAMREALEEARDVFDRIKSLTCGSDGASDCEIIEAADDAIERIETALGKDTTK